MVIAAASPDRIWQLWADVPGWRRWNAGIEFVELHGPFADGSTITMKPPGEAPLCSRLIAVNEPFGFTDETMVGPVRVMVDHHCEVIDDSRVCITYSISVTGENAEAICDAVSEDFPEVLAALTLIAEGGCAMSSLADPSAGEARGAPSDCTEAE